MSASRHSSRSSADVRQGEATSSQALLEQAFAFGLYRFFPAQRLLLNGRQAVPLGARAVDILLTLLQNRGEVVSKDLLIARAWPNTHVDETNLRVQIAAIRRALNGEREGRRAIVAVPGRGYTFAAPATLFKPEPPPYPDHPPDTGRPAELPAASTRIIGRSEPLRAIIAQLHASRLITIVGHGGIGKTTVAVAAARESAHLYEHGVAFLDLSTLTDPALLPGALAVALGVTVETKNLMPTITAFLARRSMLLLIDNCEHVIEAAAALVERVLDGSPGTRVLATSRESLRIAGERTYRLAPLNSPPVGIDHLGGVEALTYSGVELFVERAEEALGHYKLRDEDAPLVAQICRSLDGIALGIELAARRLDALDLASLSAQLSDRFRLLTAGRRTAPARQQTLSATLDWSYRLLPEPEQGLLRRLAVFAGRFSLQDAAVMLTPGENPSAEAAEIARQIAELVAKSLLSFEAGSAGASYRMLETMRLYGLEKLREHGELDGAARRHAKCLETLLASSSAHPDRRGETEVAFRQTARLPDVRAALDWAFGAGGELALAASLTAKAVPIWVAVSLFGECRERIEQVLAMTQLAAGSRDGMLLQAGLGWSLMYTSGSRDAVELAWRTALVDAEALGDTSYRLHCLWGLWANDLNRSAFQGSLTHAEAFRSLADASPDPFYPVMADELVGTSLHFMGDQERAANHLAEAFRWMPEAAALPLRLQRHRRVVARYFLARVSWLRGLPDRARDLAQENIDVSSEAQNTLSFGSLLEQNASLIASLRVGSVLGQAACPIALWCGDLEAAERFSDLLAEHAAQHGLQRQWGDWARCFGGLVRFKRGDRAGLDVVREHLAKADDTLAEPRYILILGEYAGLLGEAGEIGLGLEVLSGVIARSERNSELWLLPELLRQKGELVRLEGRAAEAAALFERGLALAIRQGALSWELRLATSLARLRPDPKAKELVRNIYGRFTEGLKTADLRAARALLDAPAPHWVGSGTAGQC